MKSTYSTFHVPIWGHFKAGRKDRSERAFYDYAEHLLNLLKAQSASADVLELNHTLLRLFAVWKYHKIAHYFLGDGVADFCSGSVKELSEDYCKTLPRGEKIGDLFPEGVFAIHFPARENRRSIIVAPSGIVPTIDAMLGKCNDAYTYFFLASDSVDIVHACRNTRLCGGDELTDKMVKTVFGLSLYMDAFPETVKPSSDGDIHRAIHYEGPRHLVGANNIVTEECDRSTSPHWRRGHFRMLNSPRFVRKQGQTVYVRGTFVCGESFDVQNLEAVNA